MARTRTRSRWRLSREAGPARAWVPPVRPASPDAGPRLASSGDEERDGGGLAGSEGTTHVLLMQAQAKTQIVGFMELQVGSIAVQVPIRAVGSPDAVPTDAAKLPLASFEVEGENYAILIRGDSSSKAVERAMGDAAQQALLHLSKKLLN